MFKLYREKTIVKFIEKDKFKDARKQLLTHTFRT